MLVQYNTVSAVPFLCLNSVIDVKGGCLTGGNLGCGSLGAANGSSNRYRRGVQVFTYKELEVATEGFSERNVIGNGGHGVVYKGVLSDGTVAAIKMLHWQGKQGERAFRIEVIQFHFIYLHFLSLFAFSLFPSLH